MQPLPTSSAPSAGRVGARAAQIVVVSSVMFTFISYWRTAAVVLCDMSSTVFYIGAIVESAIGKAAPWFILAVLLFSYMMRAVYIESCALFVRGGVYRVVKEAMGGSLAKLSVSALLFDYVLTGPISGVSAGQYIIGLTLETAARIGGIEFDESTRQAIKSWGSVFIASAITLYFLRQNLLGIHESSGKALKIMLATAAMGAIMLAWSGVTLAIHGPTNNVPTWKPDLNKKVTVTADGDVVPKIDPVTGEQQDPLGWIGAFPALADPLRDPTSWLSLIGALGILIAFGHSILAMSGEETLAQVYREVEAPKLKNFKKAAFVVFAFSLMLTGTFNFLAALLIPDDQRMGIYYDNWMGGLAMQMVGPVAIRLLLNALVVVVGFLILSGAVNTSIVGSNGVLSRVAEDGVLPTWFLKPHPRLGTNYRLLYLITALQLVTIVASRGDVILLGEAYAFGVVWSFVFKTVSMLVLRFKSADNREFRVPFNMRLGGVELPIGLGFVTLIVLLSALANLFTKPVATMGGLTFTGLFLAVFVVTERLHKRRHEGQHEHLEQFNRTTVEQIDRRQLELTKPFCKLVAIRSPNNLFMLDKALADNDPQTTDVVVMTAKVQPLGMEDESEAIDVYDQQLLTAVVNHAERLGKTVTPLLVPTNQALHAVLSVARDLSAQEVTLGASNKFSAEEQLDQVSLYWISIYAGEPRGLTVHIVGADRTLTFDLHGGNRIPRAVDRQARSAADLRRAGVGVRRVLLVHDGRLASHDAFQWLLTLVADEVRLDLLPVCSDGTSLVVNDVILSDQQQAEQLGRSVELVGDGTCDARVVVQQASDGNYDVIVLPWQQSPNVTSSPSGDMLRYVQQNAPCRVLVVAPPAIPREVSMT